MFTRRAVLSFSLATASLAALCGPVAAFAQSEEEFARNGRVAVEMPKHLVGVKRVVVPQFTVSFVVEDKKSATASTNRVKRNARKAKSTTQAFLVGLTPQTMQAITDAAYADFIATLQENGIEVIEPDAAAAQAKAREANLGLVKFREGPRENYSIYHNNYNNKTKDLSLSPTGTGLMLPKIGSTALRYPYGTAARELEIPMVVVDYVVSFGHIAAEAQEYYGIAMRGDATAKTTFSPGLQIAWSSDVKVYHTEKKRGRLWLDKSAWTGEAFAVIDSETSRGFEMSKKKVTVNVDNAAYEKAAMDVIARASDSLVSTWASLN